jgi:hypothetical protein
MSLCLLVYGPLLPIPRVCVFLILFSMHDHTLLIAESLFDVGNVRVGRSHVCLLASIWPASLSSEVYFCV